MEETYSSNNAHMQAQIDTRITAIVDSDIHHRVQYMLGACSCAMFFLYRILLLPNQLHTCSVRAPSSDARPTCDTVMLHLRASSSFASSLG